MAEAAQQVNPNFGWSPFTDFVYTSYADLVTQIKAGSITFEQAMQTLQDKSVTYAKDQGFTVQAAVAPPAAAVEINFWSWVPSIQDQVDEWNKTHPDIKVNYINKGNGNTEYAALNTALQANTDIPDVVQIEYQHLPGYIARGTLLNLADY